MAQSYDNLINILTLQVDNYMTYQPDLGTPAAWQAEIAADLAMLIRAKENAAQLKAASETATGIKTDQIMNGDPSGSVPPYANTVLPAQLPDWTPGCYPRFQFRTKGMKASAGFKGEVADALGLGPTPPPDPALIQPTATFHPALMGGYEYGTVVENRGDSKMWELRVRRVGTTPWTLAATKDEKAVTLVYDAPAGSDSPIQLEGYVQLVVKGEPYGQPSAIVLFTLNP